MPLTNAYVLCCVSATLALTALDIEKLTPQEFYSLGMYAHEEGDFDLSVTLLKKSSAQDKAEYLSALHGLRTMHWSDAEMLSSPHYWWYDSDITNKKIFIKHDGGVGDAIQFIRYAQHLHNAGAYVMIETPPVLSPLYSQCTYIDQQIPYGSTPSEADITLTIATPILTYTVRHDIEARKTDVPYIFADQNLCNSWHTLLAPLPGKKIGICWCSSPLYNVRTKEKFLSPRSIPLTLFEPLLSYDCCSFISLQCGYGVEQLHDVKNPPRVFEHIDTKHGRFMDTMAIIKNLDLVITVDTSIAHIAGALGVPVWLILPKCSDFRWFSKRSDSVWYPTMRIFRQKPYEIWNPVLKEVFTALKELYGDQ